MDPKISVTLKNLHKRIAALERRVPQNRTSGITLVLQRAMQIAARTKQGFEAVLGVAIEEFGTPLTLADVDDLLTRIDSGQL